MILLGQGIILGLSLSVLAGPMMFLFIQLGIERGFRAGAAAGLGSWTSDILFALAVYFGISYVLRVSNLSGFALVTGLIGGIILIVIGLGVLWHRPPEPQLEVDLNNFRDSYVGLWLKGFLINTFNPFAAFFWIGVMTSFSASKQMNGLDATILFGSIIGTIVSTDILKILLAKRLKPLMKSSYLDNMRKVSGVAIVLFGLILIGRVIFCG
ncbi:MAG: hypothetical protein DHS20C18_49560 [Saprospiraceae bacterium]|nr:MAG: hypothetical protein DHS20C18_49560 [Saprospiraceae bacterium]